MSETVKIVVFVPKSHADEVRRVMGDAGAGKIGNYSHCSFTTQGIGRFQPEDGAHPTIGQVGTLEAVEEERIEVMCNRQILQEVVSAIESVHPYEEVAMYIHPVEEI